MITLSMLLIFKIPVLKFLIKFIINFHNNFIIINIVYFNIAIWSIMRNLFGFCFKLSADYYKWTLYPCILYCQGRKQRRGNARHSRPNSTLLDSIFL